MPTHGTEALDSKSSNLLSTKLLILTLMTFLSCCYFKKYDYYFYWLKTVLNSIKTHGLDIVCDRKCPR